MCSMLHSVAPESIKPFPEKGCGFFCERFVLLGDCRVYGCHPSVMRVFFLQFRTPLRWQDGQLGQHFREGILANLLEKQHDGVLGINK